MNWENYVELLENNLIDFAAELYGDNWTFQQDKATKRVARKPHKYIHNWSL